MHEQVMLNGALVKVYDMTLLYTKCRYFGLVKERLFLTYTQHGARVLIKIQYLDLGLVLVSTSLEAMGFLDSCYVEKRFAFEKVYEFLNGESLDEATIVQLQNLGVLEKGVTT